MDSMRCDEAHGLGALADGELTGPEREDLLNHLRGCATCRGEVEALGRMSRNVKRARLRAPASLRSRIGEALETEERGSEISLIGRQRRIRVAEFRSNWRSGLGQAASLAAACLLTAVLTWSVARTPDADRPASDAFSAHLRGLLQDNQVQIASADRHIVKPWFAGRLAFAPAVKDLTSEGFPLVGGRVDVIDQGRAAALVYRRRLHAITVFVRPGTGSEEPKLTRMKGYSVIAWTKDGLSYVIVSDLNEAELLQLQALL